MSKVGLAKVGFDPQLVSLSSTVRAEGSVGPRFSRQHSSFHPRCVSIQQQVLSVGRSGRCQFRGLSVIGAGHTPVPASSAHKVETVAIDDGA